MFKADFCYGYISFHFRIDIKSMRHKWNRKNYQELTGINIIDRHFSYWGEGW